MPRIRAVLFDIDGTLLDSNDAHAHAWLDSLRGHGVNVPFDYVRSRIGLRADRLLAEVAHIDLASPEGRSVDERRAAILRAHYLPDLGPFHGARVLVDRLRSRGLICAAIANAAAIEVADLLHVAGIADLMDEVISLNRDLDERDDLDARSNLIAIALDRIGITAAEALLIGDTPYDIEAGRDAGVVTVAFRCGGRHSDRDFAGASAIYDDPADLSSQLDRSLLALDRDSSPAVKVVLRPRRVAQRGLG